MRKTLIIVLSLTLWALTGRAQGTRSAEVQLKAALHKEQVEGDLKGAIELYKKLAQSADRPVAAKALVHMGECYERMGDTEARKAYERVVRDFGDQSEQASQARTRLAAMERGKGPTLSGISVRKVWDDAMGSVGTPAPDGRYLSFTDWSSGDLAIRDLKTGENRRLTKKGSWAAGPDQESDEHIISPDGKLVLFNWCRCARNEFELRVIGTDGSGDRVLSKKSSYMKPLVWSPDGRSVVYATNSGDGARIVAISIADGSERELLRLVDKSVSKGAFSPDGRYLAYSTRPEKNVVPEDIYVLDLQAPSVNASFAKLVEHPADDKLMGWSPDGKYILFQSDRNGSRGAWLLPMLGGKASGPPQLVKPDLASITSEVIPQGFTSSGSFYYALRLRPLDAQVATLDPATGRLTGPPTPFTNRFSGSTCCPQWSPDGKRVLYRGPNATVVIRSLDDGEERELLPQLAQTVGVRWHPDGQSLVVTGQSKENRPGAYRVDLATGAATLLVPLDEVRPNSDAEISPDGKTLYYRSGAFRVAARNLATGVEKVVHQTDPGTGIQNTALSRDGRYLALGVFGYGAAVSRVIVVPTAGGEAQELMKTEPLSAKIFAIDWTPDGRYLLATLLSDLKAPTLVLWRVPVEGGEPQKTATFPMTNYFTQARIHMHSDGRRLAITAGHQKFELWAMENFLPKVSASR